MMSKLNKISVFVLIKYLIALYMSYSLLLKGGAGAIAHSIGSYIVGGNYIIGAIILSILFVIYFVFMRLFYIDIIPEYKRIISLNMLLDFIWGIVNFVGAYIIWCCCFNFPQMEALPKIITECGGTTVILYLVTVLVFGLLLLKPKYNDNSKPLVETKNLPFILYGKIGRLPYFLTMLFVMIATIVTTSIIMVNALQTGILGYLFFFYFVATLVITIVDVFATSKRLRDIQWKQLYILLLLIPLVSVIARLPLLFIKGKAQSVG